MRTIEKKMLQALRENKEITISNTRVENHKTGQFVRLYSTLIYAKVNGKEYFSDGGYRTSTTASRLRALGANYSYSCNADNQGLISQNDMFNLICDGKIK